MTLIHRFYGELTTCKLLRYYDGQRMNDTKLERWEAGWYWSPTVRELNYLSRLCFQRGFGKPNFNFSFFHYFRINNYENVLKIKTIFEGGRSVEKAWFHLNKEIISVFCSQLWMWFALQMTCHLVFDWWSWIMTWSDRRPLSIARYKNFVLSSSCVLRFW